MDNGVIRTRQEGTPQGGRLSPLLAKVSLDEVAKELERRSQRFARYADGANVHVRRQGSGERVRAVLRGWYAKLHLGINEGKSVVAGVFGRKFLGYNFPLATPGVESAG